MEVWDNAQLKNIIPLQVPKDRMQDRIEQQKVYFWEIANVWIFIFGLFDI